MNNLTVESIRISNEGNKTALYLNLAKSYANKASELASEDKFIQRKLKQEVIDSYRKCESAKSEYQSYADAHATEVWFMKLEGVCNGTLSMKDLF